MRKWQILASIFALLVVCDEAKAGDKEDVLAYMDGVYTSINAGDWDAVPFRSHTRFNEDGGLLRHSDPEATRAWIKSSGITLNLQAFHKKDASGWRDVACHCSGDRCICKDKR